MELNAFTKHTTQGGTECHIAVQGRLDYHLYRDFETVYARHKNIDTYVVDLGGATRLDSSALAVLMLLREHAGGNRSRVRLINSPPDIARVLSIHHFEELFTIEQAAPRP